MKILVVVDVQKDFIDGILGTKEAQQAIPKIIAKIKDFDGFYILCTRDSHDNNYEESLESRKILPHCIIGTEGKLIPSEISDLVLNQMDTKFVQVIDKNTFGTLYIGQHFQNANIDKIEIIGFCTDICVITNALILRTYFPNIPIIVDASCCAGTTPENHEKALDIMEQNLIDIINR